MENVISNLLFEMLETTATAERARAVLTLELLSQHSVGIGDHSTGDFYKNAEEALQRLMDAEGKLETLKKYEKVFNRS